MAFGEDLGNLLSSWVQGGYQAADVKRKNDYQDALTKQWLDQAIRAEKDRKERQAQYEQERSDRRTERETDHYNRLFEKEGDRKYQQQREDATRAREEGAAKQMIDQWVASKRWKTPADAERAKVLGLAAWQAHRDPISAMDDGDGLIKNVDPDVALRRAQLLQDGQDRAEARQEAERQKRLRQTVEELASGFTTHGTAPTPALLELQRRSTPERFKDFSDREVSAAIEDYDTYRRGKDKQLGTKYSGVNQLPGGGRGKMSAEVALGGVDVDEMGKRLAQEIIAKNPDWSDEDVDAEVVRRLQGMGYNPK